MKSRLLFAFVSFDQQLYTKARKMDANTHLAALWDLLCFVLVIFTCCSPFWKLFGFIMTGSGLEELWNTFICQKSIIYMINGNTYPKEIKALYLLRKFWLQFSLSSTAFSENSKNMRSWKLILRHSFRRIFQIKKQLTPP